MSTPAVTTETVTLATGATLPRVGLGVWQARTGEAKAAVAEALRQGVPAHRHRPHLQQRG